MDGYALPPTELASLLQNADIVRFVRVLFTHMYTSTLHAVTSLNVFAFLVNVKNACFIWVKYASEPCLCNNASESCFCNNAPE